MHTSDVSSVSSLRSMCQVAQEDFCEALIEACVNDVCGEVRSLVSRPYHVTDSGNGSWNLACNSKYKVMKCSGGPPSPHMFCLCFVHVCGFCLQPV